MCYIDRLTINNISILLTHPMHSGISLPNAPEHKINIEKSILLGSYILHSRKRKTSCVLKATTGQ